MHGILGYQWLLCIIVKYNLVSQYHLLEKVLEEAIVLLFIIVICW